MKKNFTLAALAMVSIVACSIEIDAPKEVTPVNEPDGNVTIIAQAPSETTTKTMIDGLDVKWATGDHIAVIDEDEAIHDFSLDSGAGTASGSFSGSLGGKESAGYALYPYTTNAGFDGTYFSVDYADTYAYNAVTVPMWGEEGTGENVGKYTFSHIGGAIKVRYYNVPDGATKFVLTATEEITGTAYTTDFTDAAILDNEGYEVTVTSLPSSSTLAFIIPVPAGDYSFSVRLKDALNNDIAGSVKTVTSAKTVSLGHVLPLREIVIPPVPNGTTLFSVNFGDYGTSTTDWTKISGYDVSDYADAGYAGRSGIGDNGYVTLTGSGDVKLSTATASGITSGHLWFKKEANGSVTTSAIKLYGATAFTLSYDQATASSASIAEYSVDNGDNWLDLGTQSGPGSAAFGATGLSASSILVRIKHQSSNSANTRVDNIVVKAGAPEPGVSVTTTAATLTESAEGTTATINGTLKAIYGGDLANVTSAGFYYKKTEDVGDYNRVTVTPGASISKALTGLSTNKEYTFYAFAIYNSGDEVYGDPLTFTPTLGVTTYSVTFTASGTSSGSLSGDKTGISAILSSNGTWSSPTIQMVADKSMTLTISGMAGKTITGALVEMKSNASKGAGSLSLTTDGKTIASISDSKFNSSNWYGAWSTSVVTVELTTTDQTVGTGKTVDLEINVSTNSLYFKSLTLEYTD